MSQAKQSSNDVIERAKAEIEAKIKEATTMIDELKGIMKNNKLLVQKREEDLNYIDEWSKDVEDKGKDLEKNALAAEVKIEAHSWMKKCTTGLVSLGVVFIVVAFIVLFIWFFAW